MFLLKAGEPLLRSLNCTIAYSCDKELVNYLILASTFSRLLPSVLLVPCKPSSIFFAIAFILPAALIRFAFALFSFEVRR
jgi:hypothetical protein